MQTRKHTAWKKNRKFGDVWGGRTFPKLADKIFNRQHNLTAPKNNETTPIYIVDNPSRDFYFPVTVDQIKTTLEKLPKDHTDHLTHIWLQKLNHYGLEVHRFGLRMKFAYRLQTDLKIQL